MFRRKKLIRHIALFLIIHTLYFTFLPTLSYALTSGPTSPEASSFEPVDTTDMVNLLTGDFTYNIPLMEVPGPAGGYPITLAYHAGIQPNQDASWVGLGWSLNPGAINRIVSGYADDHSNVRDVDRVFWEGGSQETYTIGLSVGIANVAGVMAGATFANDTYRGLGKGSFVGLGINGPIGVSGYLGNKPYGGSYYGFSVGPTLSGSMNGLNYSAALGIGYNSESGWDVNTYGSLGPLGASISSSNMKPDLSVGGVQARVHNHKAGNISTKSSSFALDIPLYGYNIRLGYDYQRYWIDETADVYTNGSLYYPSSTIASTYFDDHAYDTYDILDKDIDIVDHSDPEKVLGGSFPDYDQYTVLAQGLSGNIRPYHFQKDLVRQNKKDNNTSIIKNYALTQVDKPVEFRFINDLSNRFEYTPKDFEGTGAEPLAFEFDNSMITGETGTDGYINNHLAGSRHVEWLTNEQILNGEAKSKGFIDNRAAGFVREDNLQIGGFMIVNESGVTYHFSLPAYSFDEFMKSENTVDYKHTEGDMYNELSKPEKYAYTWFLTAVTGPDFVDKNDNGLVDDGDLGYWVGFEYGKWTDNYWWRNPGEGFHKDVDRKFQNFSTGKKELYYLDAIHTASHTAVFIKKIRNDGKGVTSMNGGYNPVKNGDGTVETAPISVLGLKEVYLFKNEDFDFWSLFNRRTTGIDYNKVINYCICCSSEDPLCIFPNYEYGDCEEQDGCGAQSRAIQIYIDSHMGNNVIDETDFDNEELFQKALRGVSLETDYSLCPKTPNSYERYFKYNSLFNPYFPELYKSGKLTLKALHFLGKGGVSIMPPTKFTYDKNPDYNKDAYDMWGFYKSDYIESDNENLARLTSAESALNVDAWSLSTIETSLGAKIKIKYESDEYKKPTLYKNNILTIKEIIPSESLGKVKILFYEKDIHLIETYLSESSMEVLLRKEFKNRQNVISICDGKAFAVNGSMGNFYEVHRYSSEKFNIINIGESFIEIASHELYDKLLETKMAYYTESPCENYLGNSLTPLIEIMKPVLVAGNMIYDGDVVISGGGLRAKEIIIENPITAQTSSIAYEYQSGTTGYEPIGLEKITFYFGNFGEYYWEQETKRIEKAKAAYKKSIYQNFSNLLAISRELPGPGVVYEYVTVKEKRNNIELPNYTTYHFEVYKEGLVDIDEVDEVNSTLENGNYEGINYRAKNSKRVALKNYSSRIGNLKSVTLYNSDGTKVSETINDYLNDGLDDSFEQNKTVYENWLEERVNNQGVIEETFSNARFVRYKKNDPLPYNDYIPGNDEYHLLGIISKKETFPSLLMGQTNINYKTGIATTSKNLAFDFYSGAVTKTLSTDSYGNHYLSETQPAYRQYPAMGLKVDNLANKHMLTQNAATYLYKVNNETDITPTGLLTASIQTWSNATPILKYGSQPEIWRKEAGYTWDGQETLNTDGTYKMSDFSLHPFNWADPAGNTNWQKLTQISLYDHYSHALEAIDINGKYVATRMDYKQEKVIASAANASYHEMAFSGAEYNSINATEEGGVLKGDGNAVFNQGHTGDYALLVSPGRTGFNYTIGGDKADLSKKYRASVWVYLPGEAETAAEIENAQLYYTINGQEIKSIHPQLHKNKSKSWYLLNLDVDPSPGGDIVISCRNNTSRGIYFDDFRVHPLDAAMNTYVYDQKTGELTYILDSHNIYTHYEYDALGRVIKVSRERLNFDFGEGQESYRADQVVQEAIYSYGEN